VPRLHRRLALLIAVLSLTVPVASAHAMPTPGVNLDGIPSDTAIDQAAALGARQARMFVLWASVEPAAPSGGAHRYDQSILQRYDQIVARLNRNGMKPVFVLTTSPPWASGSSNYATPPKDPATFAAFAGDFAKRYAGKVAAYEVWNEQDSADFWSTGPDAGGYTALLKPAYGAIKAADPSARVLAGPLTGNNYPFVEQMYAAGAKGSFDGLSVHTDTACLDRGPDVLYRDPAFGNRVGRFSFLGYREVRAVMLAHGDDKPVWMTELGWSSTTTRCARGSFAGQKPAGVGEAGQARNLKLAYHCLAADPYVESALWFTQRDLGAEDTEMNRYGLFRPDGSHKPSWDAFHSVATQGDTVSGPCGDFEGPRIEVLRPATGERYERNLPISVRVSDASGRGRVRYYADGVRFRSIGVTGSLDVLWTLARKLSYGPHTIKIEAYDSIGNVSSTTVQVVHVRKGASAGGKARKTKVRANVRVKGRTATVSGQVSAAGGGRPAGKVKVIWQWSPGTARSASARGKLAWKHVGAVSRGAAHPFTVRRRLARAGTWRVRVRYAGSVAHAPSASPWRYAVVR
jgi:hypothetical protein